MPRKSDNEPKQTKVTIALDAYPDVKWMVRRYLKENPDHGPTDFGIPAFRKYFTKLGFAKGGRFDK